MSEFINVKRHSDHISVLYWILTPCVPVLLILGKEIVEGGQSGHAGRSSSKAKLWSQRSWRASAGELRMTTCWTH